MGKDKSESPKTKEEVLKHYEKQVEDLNKEKGQDKNR